MGAGVEVDGDRVVRGSASEVFAASLRLGLTSFGGPIAHVGHFRREYVDRRGWLDPASFGDIVALSQVLPGPSSSQLGIAIGTLRAGYLGGAAAWLGFTLPSVAAMIALALLTADATVTGGWVEGLKLAAVAVVAQAVYVMARSLTPDLPRAAIALVAAVVVLAAPVQAAQVLVIAGGALLGWAFLGSARAPAPETVHRLGGRHRDRTGVILLVAFVALLVGLPVAARLVESQAVSLVDAFYRSGALVFGGGHVVLPLLSEAVVTPGWVGEDRFLAGYGAAQAVPGPLFSFAGFLGASMTTAPTGLAGGILAVVAIFLPSFLLVWGTLPSWDRLRRSETFVAALRGTNAAVVGILLAALITPVASSALHGPVEVILAGAGLTALATGRVPPIVVVAGLALAGQAFGLG